MASGFTKNRLKISQSCPLWDRSPADRIDGVSGAGRGSLKDPSRIPQMLTAAEGWLLLVLVASTTLKKTNEESLSNMTGNFKIIKTQSPRHDLDNLGIISANLSRILR